MTLIKNFRNLLALTYLLFFALWLAAACFIILPVVLSQPEGLDPMLSLVAGLGMGGVTQFFVVIGTLIFQFYYRKAVAEETPPTTPLN